MCKPKVPSVESSPQTAPQIAAPGLESVFAAPRIADVDALAPRRDNPLRIQPRRRGVPKTTAPAASKVKIKAAPAARNLSIKPTTNTGKTPKRYTPGDFHEPRVSGDR